LFHANRLSKLPKSPLLIRSAAFHATISTPADTIFEARPIHIRLEASHPHEEDRGAARVIWRRPLQPRDGRCDAVHFHGGATDPRLGQMAGDPLKRDLAGEETGP